MSKYDKKTNIIRGYHLGSIIFSMTLSGFLIGYATDYLLGTIPIFLFVFGVMGFIGGLIKLNEQVGKK